MVESSTWAPSAEDERKEDSLMIEESREDLWEGSPLQIGRGMDPHSTEEIIIESDAGDEEVLKLKHRRGVYLLRVVPSGNLHRYPCARYIRVVITGK